MEGANEQTKGKKEEREMERNEGRKKGMKKKQGRNKIKKKERTSSLYLSGILCGSTRVKTYIHRFRNARDKYILYIDYGSHGSLRG